MMKAVRVHSPGGVDKLTVEEISLPEIKPDQVLVRNSFAGINYIDTYHRSGVYPVTMPFVLGREGAGIIEAVGEKVDGLRAGERVAYVGSFSYAEYTAVDAKHVVRLPDGIQLETGAAMMLQGLTAALLVYDAYPVHPGDFVLVPVSHLRVVIGTFNGVGSCGWSR